MTPRRSLLRIIGRLLALLDRQERRRFSLVAGLSALNAVMEGVAALFVLALVGAVTETSSSTTDPVGTMVRRVLGDDASSERFTVAVALATLVFYLAKNASSLVETYLQQRTVHTAAADASTRVVATYLRVPMSFHYLQRSGDFLRNSWSATEQVYRTCMLGAVTLVSELLAGLALVTVLVIVAPTVTPLVIAILGAATAALYFGLRRRLTLWGDEMQNRSAGTLQALQDAFGALRDARILSREMHFVERFRDERLRLAKSFWRSGTATTSPRLALETAFIVTMVGAVLILMGRDETGSTAVSLLGLYGYAGLRLMPSANRIVFALGNLRLGENGVEILQEALALPQEPATARDRTISAFERDIVLERVSYTFAEAGAPAVIDVSLTIRKGETIGVVGPSGGGKSTLVDLIVGLLVPETGTVEVDGTPIVDDLSGWRRQIGYVSQSVFLLDDTLRANVSFGHRSEDVDDDALWEALEMAQLADFVRGLPHGVESRLGERGVRLSGGQRQRVAVARALYHRPSVLVFDEATAALDTKTEEDLSAAIETLASTRTVLIVAHRLSTIRACDRIVVMAHGRVSDVGTFDELAGRDATFRELVAAGQV